VPPHRERPAQRPAPRAASPYKYLNVEGIRAEIEERDVVYEQADRVNFSGNPVEPEFLDGRPNPAFGYGRHVKVAAEFYAKLENMLRLAIEKEFERCVNVAGYHCTKGKANPETVELIMPVAG
jgi:hypothetical protein